jgi:hypothetical protein
MALKIIRKTINTDSEKILVTGLITSDKFIKSVEPYLKSNLTLLKTSYARMVSSWCLDFYDKYKVAPKKNIQQIYEDKKLELEEDTLEIISELLAGLSKNYEREKNFNEEYAIDQALNYLNLNDLERLENEIREARHKNQIEKAKGLIEKYKKIEKPTQEFIDAFEDIDKVIEYINHEVEGIYTFPGVLGELLGPFDRGNLIAVAAPAKRGKTFWLIELAIRLCMASLRVFYFSLEMTEKEMFIRIQQNVLGELKYLNRSKVDEIKIPYFEEDEEKEGKFNIKYREVEKDGLTNTKIRKKAKHIITLSRSGRLRTCCVPNSSMGVEQIYDAMQTEIVKNNFIPDVVVIDYADIIKPSFKTEHRNQIDHTWRYLRRMAGEMHCLFITASHCNKKTLEKDIKQGDLSEDSRKLNHVSLMWALNQNEKDRELGVMRASVLASRFDDFYLGREAIITQNLAIGKPFLDSRWKSDVLNYRKK